jgi:hypothetical protein
MDKTEQPYSVKDEMLVGPNGSWRIKDVSAVLTHTKSHSFQKHVFFWLWLLIGCVVAGFFLSKETALGFLVALASIALPFIFRIRWMRTSSDTLQVEAIVSGVKLRIWQKTYGSRNELEVKAQGDGLVSLIRGAMEKSSEAKEKAAP